MVELIHTYNGTVYAQRNGVLIPVNTDGLVGYWPMTKGSGGTLYDESKNGNDGTLNNGPVWTDTANGKALDFDGVDDYVALSTMSGLDTSTPTTFMAWINTNSDHNGIFISGDDGDNYRIFQFKKKDTGTIRVIFDNGEGIGNTIDSNSQPNNQWIHATFTSDSSGVELFIDGISSDSTAQTMINGNPDYRLGQNSSGSNKFDGTIDEVRIYDRALSAQEITNIYEKTRGLYGI